MRSIVPLSNARLLQGARRPYAAPTTVGGPLLRPVPLRERLQPTNRAAIHSPPHTRASGAWAEVRNGNGCSGLGWAAKR